MQPICLHDRAELASFLRQDASLHLYSLGDLDDEAWPYTTWYGVRDGGVVRACILVYTRYELPVLLALGEGDRTPLAQLLRGVLPRLPRRFYAHLSPGLEDVLTGHYELTPHGRHRKMALADPSRAARADTSDVVRLSSGDADAALALYRAGYPGCFFHAAEMGAKPYFGIWGEGRLIAIAGVHAYSERYRVAALGNITTHPEHRGRGHAKRVTAGLCQYLAGRTDHIGLNVRADNASAIGCYHALGFEAVAAYGEYTATSRDDA